MTNKLNLAKYFKHIKETHNLKDKTQKKHKNVAN